MRFNQHSELKGRHAFLSPSTYHWLNYDEQKLEARYHSASAAKRGTDLHELAHEAIRLRVPLEQSNAALAEYVNDGIEYGMACEQPLYYSENCFGCADNIKFVNARPKPILRVHDLKTGISAVSFKQLEVYCALFCLEYGHDPFDLEFILRIYQREEVLEYDTTPEAISDIMQTIVSFDLQIEAIKEG